MKRGTLSYNLFLLHLELETKPVLSDDAFHSANYPSPIDKEDKKPSPKGIWGRAGGDPPRGDQPSRSGPGEFDPRLFTPPRGRRAGPGNRGLPDVLFYRGFDCASGHYRDEVRTIVGLRVQIGVEAFLRNLDVRHRLGRELRGERFFHLRHPKRARAGSGHRHAHARTEIGDEHADDRVARRRVLELR